MADSPTAHSPAYDPFILSEEEKARFLAALGDGFGYSRRSQQLDEEKLPPEIDLGLLDHRAYYNRRRRSEYVDDSDQGKFWEESDGDSPPGLFEQCPLNFHLPAIRAYFREQREAYMSYAESLRDHRWLSELHFETREDWEDHIYRGALYKTYSKAWYEYHINEHIYFGDEFLADLHRHAKWGINLGFIANLLMTFSAQLGRLIEQYYWKFLVEKSAIRGNKISDAAKSGVPPVLRF
jgi:hypothetical protein